MCVDGVLASVGAAQTCEEACDRDCCIGPGVCDGLLIRVCRDSESCSGEGTCRDVSIDDVFLGCKGTEACYYAVEGGRTIEVVVRECVGKRACAHAAELGNDVGGTSATGRVARPHLAVRALDP